jgi:spore coat polysaccharide biosynthesis protein SpsF
MHDGARVVASIEARMTSSRLPGKVLMPVGGQPALRVMLDRLSKARRIDKIVVATTSNPTDDPIVAYCALLGVEVFRGSENDVLGRVLGAMDACEAHVCVELTADCPLIDPAIVDEAVEAFFDTRAVHPYVSNSDPHRSVPAGLDVQVFEVSALRTLASETSDPADREHVSYGFYRPESGDRWNPRFISHANAVGGESHLVTLDYIEDLKLIDSLHSQLRISKPHYGAADIIAWLRSSPNLEAACRRVRAGCV